MPATPVWLASAEAVFNRNIAASTPAAALARRLEGTSLQIEIEALTPIRAAMFGGRLSLLAGEPAPADALPADAVISGSPPALLQMFKSGRPAASRNPVQIRGDAEIANLYRELFVAARPDLEEELSRLIGDMPARRLAQIAKSVRSWARRARRTAGENIAEYLQEEGRDLITKTELEEFLRGVDSAREAVDRIEARLGRIERALMSPLEKGVP
jgi:ubiquinone biosynthesis accessory factor UbiJ